MGWARNGGTGWSQEKYLSNLFLAMVSALLGSGIHRGHYTEGSPVIPDAWRGIYISALMVDRFFCSGKNFFLNYERIWLTRDLLVLVQKKGAVNNEEAFEPPGSPPVPRSAPSYTAKRLMKQEKYVNNLIFFWFPWRKGQEWTRNKGQYLQEGLRLRLRLNVFHSLQWTGT